MHATPEDLAAALLAGDETATQTLNALLASLGEKMQRAQQNPTPAILDVLQSFGDGEIDASVAAAQVRAIAERTKANQSKQE